MATDPVADTLQSMIAGSGGMLVGYYVMAEFIGDDGRRHWLADFPEEQTLSYSIGLVEWARLALRAEAQHNFDLIAAMEDDDEGDD